MKFKYIGNFETPIFDEKKKNDISYFASELEIFDPWTALMFLIGL